MVSLLGDSVKFAAVQYTGVREEEAEFETARLQTPEFQC